MYAGYMLGGGYSWRLFFYVEFAFAMALLVAAFFLVEESRYTRVLPRLPSTTSSENEKGGVTKAELVLSSSTDLPPRKTLAQQLKPWSPIDHEAPFFTTMLRAFSYLLVPSALWVVTTYGLFIGLCALTFNFIFPIKSVILGYFSQ